MHLNFSKFYDFQRGCACWSVHIHPSLLNLEWPEIYSNGLDAIWLCYHILFSHGCFGQPVETGTSASDLCHCQGEWLGCDFLWIHRTALDDVLLGTGGKQLQPASIACHWWERHSSLEPCLGVQPKEFQRRVMNCGMENVHHVLGQSQLRTLECGTVRYIIKPAVCLQGKWIFQMISGSLRFHFSQFSLLFSLIQPHVGYPTALLLIMIMMTRVAMVKMSFKSNFRR